jgi:hypothetical protein
LRQPILGWPPSQLVLIIQFGPNLKFGRFLKQKFCTQKQKNIKGVPFCFKTHTGRTVRHLTSVSSIAAAFFSKQVSKGLAAEVQARPLRK